MRALLIPAAASVVLLAAPAVSAQASILVHGQQSSLACGKKIRTGVWDRPDGRTGSTKVTIQIRSARGYLLKSRVVRATDEWRYFDYTPRCGRTYKVSYASSDFPTDRYRVKVRG